MSLKSLLFGLLATFAAPWLLLVVRPYGQLASLAPVPYNEEAGDEMTGFFPPARSADQARGQEIYFNQGCAQCHTQVIRPQYVGGDGDEFKRNWGEAQEALAPKRTRQTSPYDYLGESFAALGQRRNGPDLANAGFRFKNRQQILEHLYSPQARFDWSSCPPQRHLFVTRDIQGQRSKLAIFTEGKNAPGEGKEIVPSTEALDLADYLLALRRNAPLPISLGGAKPAAAPAPAAPAAAPAPAAPAAPAK
jgi:cytochrome c oxidase cbb3-type subunit II